jgi:DNA-3-methyladenine glycosylase
MTELREALSGGAPEMAVRLLGCSLTRTVGDRSVVCRIVETEAYDQSDPASHSYRGMTPRNRVMFGPAGVAYVYLSYGLHHCMNVVTGPEGRAAGALIRAVEPVAGLDVIRANRPAVTRATMLTNGPGKLCQGLGIGPEFNGHDLERAPLTLTLLTPSAPGDVVTTTRIGLSRARDVAWRFHLRGNPYVSGPRHAV